MFEKRVKQEKTSFPYNKILHKQQQWKQRYGSSKTGGTAFGPEGGQRTQGRADTAAFTGAVERHAVFVFFLAAASGGSSLVAGTGVSPRWPLSLQSLGSRACVLWCLWLLPGVWNVPEPGLEPVSPALTVGFFSTGPPGKSRCTV